MPLAEDPRTFQLAGNLTTRPGGKDLPREIVAEPLLRSSISQGKWEWSKKYEIKDFCFFGTGAGSN